MTTDAPYDALHAAVLAGAVDRVAKILSPLSESDRRSLSKRVADLWRGVMNDTVEDPGLRLGPIRVRASQVVWSWREQRAAQFALLGACPPSTWRQVNIWLATDDTADALMRILRDRGAPWRAGWLDEIADEDGFAISWSVARRLVREGVCDRPAALSHIRAMARELAPVWARVQRKKPTIRETLLADPELLDHEIWRLFEIELGGFFWYFERTERQPTRPAKSKAARHVGWGRTLVELAGDGHIERGRLLRATLDALSAPVADGEHVPLRWLHDDLDPTVDEMGAHEACYRLLLGARVGAVVGFALRALARLDRDGRLDRRAFVADVAPVFELRAKAHPQRALTLLRRVLDTSTTGETTRAQAIERVVDATQHPAPDVVERARAILATHAPDRRDAIAAQAEAFDDDPDTDPKATADTLRRAMARAGAVGVLWADTLDDGTTLPPPWDPDPQTLQVLDRTESITPIADWQELVDLASHTVEQVDSADQIERLLDGLARLGGERPEGFARRTEALAHRLQHPDETDQDSARGTWMTLLWLLDVWLGRPWPKPPARPHDGVDGFHRWRLHEIARRLTSRRRDPLLAAPSHVGGWIDPRTLVDRLVECGTREPDPADAIQALLRLAPDPPARAEALDAADALPESPLRAPLRFALGGDTRPAAAWLDWRAIAWIAAGRARDPRASLSDTLTGIGRAARALIGGGPDALEPARITWRATTVQQLYFLGPKGAYPHLELQIDRGTSDGPARVPWKPFGGRGVAAMARRVRRLALPFTEMPTSALHRLADSAWEPLDLQRPWLVEWAARIWPTHPDPMLAAGVRWSMRRLDMAGAAASPNHAYLDSLLDPARPWSELAYLLAGITLLSRDLDARGVALDALIDGLDDGRVHPEPFASVLCRLVDGGWAKPNRLADGLAEVSRVSAWHQLAVAHVLDPLVGHWLDDDLPHGALHVLRLLHEALDAQGLVPSASTRIVLERLGAQNTSRSKTAVALRALLALEPRDEPRRRAARAAAIGSILNRLDPDPDSTGRGLDPAEDSP